MDKTGVLIIGAGQAGLSTAYYLQKTGFDFVMVERHSQLGSSWRKRYDSLTLFTSRCYSQLPGLDLKGDSDGYPNKDEIADYLEQYAEHFTFPIKPDTAVIRLTKEQGQFHAVLNNGAEIYSDSVVVATGAFQVPIIPDYAHNLSSEIIQLTPVTYRNPSQLPSGKVLVAGDGATGRQIALELANRHSVILATGKRRNTVPQRLLGRDIFWWIEKFGLLSASKDSWIGQLLRKRDPFPGKHLTLKHLAKQGINIRGRIKSIENRAIIFTEGAKTEIDAVIWAIGYRNDFSWLEIEGALDINGGAIEDNGVSPISGLYYVGRNWQTSRGSALICGVANDAKVIIRQLLLY